MLKIAQIARRRLLPLALAIPLLFAFVPIALVATHAQSPSSPLVGTKQYYLALGDSLAFGLQHNGDFTHGYVDDLFQFLQQEGVQEVANMGCPGETSVTFIQGGCPSTIPPHFPYTGPQLNAAVNFLKANPGKVSIVTLDIGVNDVEPDASIVPNDCTVPSETKFAHDLATLDTNLTGTILPALYKALTPKGFITGRIVMMNYYDPFQNICLGSPTSAFFDDFNTFNAHLAADVSGFGTIVDVFDAFGSGTTTFNTKLCTYTWFTFGCTTSPTTDIHPTTLGYSVIANTFAAVIPAN